LPRHSRSETPIGGASWFVKEDYCRELTASQWLRELATRRNYWALYDGKRGAGGTDTSSPADFLTGIPAGEPSIEPDSPTRTDTGYFRWEAYRAALAEPKFEVPKPRAHVTRCPTPFPGQFLILHIDLAASDALILSGVKALLTEERKGTPSALKRRGRKASVGHGEAFDLSSHLHSWKHHRILAVFDLRVWANLHGIRITRQQIADSLFDDLDNSGVDLVREAEAKLEEALESVDELQAILQGTN